MAHSRSEGGRPRRRRRLLRGLAVVLALAFAALQVSAFLHARAMTTFVDAPRRTARPEELGLRAKVATLFTGVVLPRPVNRATPADRGLAYRTEVVAGPRGALECWIVACSEPRGRAFLLPGYAQPKSSLLDEAVAFHELGLEVVLVDFRGCGGSDGGHTTIGYREAEDVAAVVEAVTGSRGPARTVLYGSSMGAAAALRARGELGVAADALVLEAPFASLLETVRHRFEAMGLPALGLAETLVFWGGVQRGFDGLGHRPRDYARGVDAPCLVLRGADDTRVTAGETDTLLEALAGPAELHVFGGTGHEPCLARNPDEWRTVVAEFLGRPAGR